MKDWAQHELQALLDDGFDGLEGEQNAACASLAVLKDNRIFSCGANVAPEATFFVGSITKMFTAVLVLQRVERGQLSLDGTLEDYLPEFRPNDRGVADQITLEQLLSHTSGLDGDRFVDTGDADAYLEQFVEACAGVELLHPPGAFFSYCNLAYNLLARIVEKVDGALWDDILERDILMPLELVSASTRLSTTFPRVSGYTFDANTGQPRPLSPESRSNTPSGTRLVMNAPDLLRFARQFFTTSIDGALGTLLAPDSLRDMLRRKITTPFSDKYQAWGLGVMHFAPGVVGHNGGTAGTASFLRILPDQSLAIVLMTNSHQYRVLANRVLDQLLDDLPGLDLSSSWFSETPEEPLVVEKYVGIYERHGLCAEIYHQQDQLRVRLGGEYGYPDSPIGELRPLSESLFNVDLPVAKGVFPMGFSGFDDSGCPHYLHFQDRAYRRASTGPRTGSVR